VRREVLARLKPLRIPKCPFANLADPSPGRWGSGVPAEEMAKMQWTKPEVVAQIRFVDIWTPPALPGRLRFWMQDRTADDISGLWLPPSRRALMTIRSQEPHEWTGV
jgi:hypothetical protein